jgi:cytochrome c
MIIQLKPYFLVVALSAVTCYAVVSRPKTGLAQDNTAPTVKIIAPSAAESFKWNELVRYSIGVTDKEDGSSEYSEIEGKEVLLKVVYLPDSSQAQTYLANEKKISETRGLTIIKTSACFNCHSLKNKLIGPSFQAIAQRYPNTKTSIGMLANKVMKGSVAVWGTTAMPPHPELEKMNAMETIRWILLNGSNPNIDYLPGLEGAFHAKPKPGTKAGKAVYILTATYTDHGIAGGAQKKQGSHSVILRGTRQ